MPDSRTVYASEQEVEELRGEVRRLRDEQQRAKKEPDDSGKEEKPQEEAKKPHPLRKFILIAAVLLVALVGVLWWMHSATPAESRPGRSG